MAVTDVAEAGPTRVMPTMSRLDRTAGADLAIAVRLRAVLWEFAERIGQHDQRNHTPSARPARQRGWNRLSGPKQRPRRLWQETQHPSGEDSEAEWDDRHPRFCHGDVAA